MGGDDAPDSNLEGCLAALQSDAELDVFLVGEKPLLGGFPGGWIGMTLFRHKTRKLSFKLKMFAVTILNPAWLVLWLWIDGRI